MKTLILGLGNPIVSDDAVGLRVAEAVRARLAGRADVEVSEDYRGGLRLMERMAGYDRAIIIDAIQTGAPAGTVRRLAAGDMPTQRSASSHDVNLPTALELGRRAGLPLPADADVVLIAVEAADIINFGETLTPAVEAAVPRAVEEALRVLDDFAAGAAGEPGGAAASDERKQGP